MSEKLYVKVYNDIISKVKDGTLKVGDKLPTELELAEQYGVSRITITRAMKELNDINLIYRVKKAGTYINGKVNFKTSQLIIPIIMPFHEDFNDIVKGIQSITTANNIFTPFYDTRNNIKKEQEFLVEILRSEFDGLIVYPCNSILNIGLYAKIMEMNKPIVCIDRGIMGIDTPLVTSKNAKGMEQIVDILVQNGHKKIGFFSVNESMAITERDRFIGFCSGLIKHNLEIKKEYIFNSDKMNLIEMHQSPMKQHKLFHSYTNKCIDEFLALPDKPTAICCINDVSANGFFLDATERNIKIPEEVTLTGFDSIDVKTNAERHILSVSQNFREIGLSAIQLLLDMLNGQKYEKTRYIDVLMNPCKL